MRATLPLPGQQKRWNSLDKKISPLTATIRSCCGQSTSYHSMVEYVCISDNSWPHWDCQVMDVYKRFLAQALADLGNKTTTTNRNRWQPVGELSFEFIWTKNGIFFTIFQPGELRRVGLETSFPQLPPAFIFSEADVLVGQRWTLQALQCATWCWGWSSMCFAYVECESCQKMINIELVTKWA